jgi:hypothetical protein
VRRFAGGAPPGCDTGTRAFPALYPLSLQGITEEALPVRLIAKKAIDRAGGALAFFRTTKEGRQTTDDVVRFVESLFDIVNNRTRGSFMFPVIPEVRA